METSYVDTILIEANRKSSPEYLASFAGNASNPSLWTNSVGAGIKLDIGDKISVHSAYISEIGNESATIEIKGKQATNNTGVGQSYTSEQNVLNKTLNEQSNRATLIPDAPLDRPVDDKSGNFHWNTISSSETNKIRDDEINLTHSYFKCNQGDNYISLPRTCAYDDVGGYPDASRPWSMWNSSRNGSVVDVNPYRYGGDYATTRYGGNASGWGFNDGSFTIPGGQRTEIINDGNRYTLFVRSNFTNFTPHGELTTESLMGHRDPALADYKWFKKTVNYKIKNGFNSPANVADSFSNQMNNVNKIEKYAYGDEANGSTISVGQDSSNQLQLTAETPTNQLFPCATAYNSFQYAKHWFDDTYTNGVLHTQSMTWIEFQNQFELNGVRFFTDGTVIPGMTLVDVTDLSTSNTPVGMANLIGATVTSVRDTSAGGGTTQITFDRETTDHSAGATNVEFQFSNAIQMSLYDSCYSTIGYKRPEIQQEGRNLSPFYKDGNNDSEYKWATIDGSYLTNVDTSYPNNASVGSQPRSLIFSGILWTEDNLTRVKNLLEAEELYPELFDYTNMSASQQELVGANNEGIMNVDKVRYLWMNDGHSASTMDVEISVSGSGSLDTTEYILVSVADYNKVSAGVILYGESWNGGTGFGFNSSNTWVTSKQTVGSDYRLYISSRLVNFAVGTVRFSNACIGDDKYYAMGRSAGAIFFDYNKDRKDIRGGEGLEISRFNSLTYGFGMKYEVFGQEYIGFSVEEQFHNKTIPQPWFDTSASKISARSIGFDKHFNGYGTASILLTNGLCSLWGTIYDNELIDNAGNPKWRAVTNASVPTKADGTPDIFHTWQPEPSEDGFFFNASTYGPSPPANGYWASLFNEIYMGANKPQLGFDSLSSRFQFLDLHTSELIGTDSEFVNNGSDVADGINPVYKVNKRLSRLNYSPNFIPYNNVFKIHGPWTNGSGVAVAELDKNITPYSIMDAMGGIFFEDYGVDEANWKQSLWELLGFTYDQFHQTSANRLARFNNTKITTSTPTTNALVRSSDVQLWVKEGLSDIQVFNTPKALYPAWVFPAEQNAGSSKMSKDFATANKCFAMPGNKRLPAIVQSASSTSIIADNLPRKMLSPIYLIQSDIINPMYMGGREGNVTLPIVGVVNKSAGYGDFYTGAEDGTIFTNTIPRTIQNVKTSIVDADGTASRVDDSSCIIYKIQKQISDNSRVIADILNPPKSA